MRLILQLSFSCPGWLDRANARLSEFGDRAELARHLKIAAQLLANTLSGLRATCPLQRVLEIERYLHADLLGSDRERIANELEDIAAQIRANAPQPSPPIE